MKRVTMTEFCLSCHHLDTPLTPFSRTLLTIHLRSGNHRTAPYQIQINGDSNYALISRAGTFHESHKTATVAVNNCPVKVAIRHCAAGCLICGSEGSIYIEQVKVESHELTGGGNSRKIRKKQMVSLSTLKEVRLFVAGEGLAMKSLLEIIPTPVGTVRLLATIETAALFNTDKKKCDCEQVDWLEVFQNTEMSAVHFRKIVQGVFCLLPVISCIISIDKRGSCSWLYNFQTKQFLSKQQ